MSEEPIRWRDDPELDEALRETLEAGHHEKPSEAQLASLAARLGPLMGPGGGGSGGSGGTGGAAATGGGVALKSLGVLMVVAAAGIGGTLTMRESTPPPAPEVTPEAPAPEAPAPMPIPVGLDPPEASPPPVALPLRSRPAAPPSFETDPAAELALIRHAQAALRSDPAEALRTTVEHRRRFGDGTLAQEREVLAIDALTRLGRETNAGDRAARFHSRWPRSAHRRRIDVILGGG